MPKAKKTKVQSVEEKQEAGEVLPLTGNSEKSGPMSKEEWCKANDISRPGSLSAQEAYKVYLSEQETE